LNGLFGTGVAVGIMPAKGLNEGEDDGFDRNDLNPDVGR